MRSLLKTSLVVVLLPGLCFAQTPAAEEEISTPPPLVPAPAPDAPGTPPPPGGGAAQTAPSPGTPPPPGFVPPPGQPSPYGAPYGTPFGAQPWQKPKPEIGLMVSETLFGMLTAAATTLLPYFLLIRPSIQGTGGLPPGEVAEIVTLLVFATTPLAVSQTQLGLANGSRYYESEGWPAPLAGLAVQAGLYGIARAISGAENQGGAITASESAATFLVVSTILVVPIAEMIVINLFKQPRGQSEVATSGLRYTPEKGLTLGLPMPSPTVGQTRAGLASGLDFSIFSGRF